MHNNKPFYNIIERNKYQGTVAYRTRMKEL